MRVTVAISVALGSFGLAEPEAILPDLAPGETTRKTVPPQTSAATKVDLAEIEAQIAKLRVEDVAWRQIPWRTCLISGLRESRETGKPAVLWVFIDRPVDDKRC